MKLLCIIVAAATILQLLSPTTAQVDLTLVPGANGSDVVDATVHKIRRSQIFSDDHNLLPRIAYVESEFGNASRTPNDGGIWQVNPDKLTKSKASNLEPLHAQINSTFGISWPDVTYTDLLKPLYSALAASLYLTSLPSPIPQKINDQAGYWLEYYNQRDYTEEIFIIKIREMEEKQRNCSAKLDVELALDSSGSVEAVNFDKARSFIISLLGKFDLNVTRVGLLTFDTVVTQIFRVQDILTLDQMAYAINNYEYLGGGTNTNEAIRRAVEDLEAAPAREEGIPRALIVLTDGRSGTGVSNIELAKNKSISTFAVGIGGDIYTDELLLIALNNPNRVFELSDFDALVEFFKRLNEETCVLPQKPGFNVTTADELEFGERRYYEYPLGSNGITVKIGDLLGQVTGFYSRTTENPSSAINDGLLGPSTYIDNNGGASKVYLTVQGVQPNNLYTITVYQGKV